MGASSSSLTGGIARRFVHGDRQRIPEAVLLLVACLALLPLLAVALRVLALTAPAPVGVLTIGEWLNHTLDLSWVRSVDRDVVLHVLLLPLAALLTAFVRLSLGIRVLGFRAILIAIGFQEVGLLPSLLLIASIALTVLFVRPLMRRVGLPLYARVAAILCIVALTMTGGLLLGAAFDLPALWSVAFFPVVILAMLAESIADTLARQNTLMAAWRTATTIALAGVIALLSQLEPIRALMLACPELILSQLAAIVLVAELLDWRLLEGFHPGAGEADGTAERSDRFPLVVVRNRFNPSVIAHRGTTVPRRYRQPSLQLLVDALRDAGYPVTVLEGDATLPDKLRSVLPKPVAGEPPGVVLNFAGGVQGRGRLAQVPALCEMLGVPYTGPDPQALGRLSDRFHLLAALRSAGLRTPRSWTPGVDDGRPGGGNADDGAFPVVVRYRDDADRRGRTVRDPEELTTAIGTIEREGWRALVEEQPGGYPLTVIVIEQHRCGNAVLRPLPPVRRKRAAGRGYGAAALPDTVAQQVEQVAGAAFRALDCRGLARIDLVLTASDEVVVCDVRPIVLPDRGGAVQVAARAAGLSLGDLGELLVQSALAAFDFDVRFIEGREPVTSRPRPLAVGACAGEHA